jgi:hypothetical protein
MSDKDERKENEESERPPLGIPNEIPEGLPDLADELPGEFSEERIEDLPPEVEAALEALLSEPFPEKPFALVPEGGENQYEHTDYLIHKDLESERQCVFLFDSIVDAFAVAEEYKQATGKNAEPVECDINTLEEDRFWVRFYRANGARVDLPLSLYKQGIVPSED